MDEKTFLQYWQTVAIQARQEASNLLGFGGRILALFVGSTATGIVAMAAGATIMTALETGLITAAIWLFIWLLFFMWKAAQQPVIMHNSQNSRMDEIATELATIKDSRPNLVLHGLPHKDTRNLRDIQSNLFRPEYFHVSFKNSPNIRTEQATARGVIAQLTYYNDQRQLIGPINGRWADTPQPGALPPLTPRRPLLPVDFESSGLEHQLTVAMKHREDDAIYAVNNDCYDYPAWKVPGFVMNEQKVFVRVRLSGDNVNDLDFWLLLEDVQGDWNIALTEPLDLAG